MWALIWPNQKKILGIVPASDEEKNKARRVAFLASRTNTMFSIPMLYFMAAGAHTGSGVRVAVYEYAGTNGGLPGDLYIITRVQPHPFFDRRGDDLYTAVPVTVTEASLGAKVEVPTIDGRAQVRIPPGTNSGKKLRLREKGAPSSRQPGKRGDQIIEVQVVVPKPEDERVRNLLKELSKIDPEDPRKELFAKAAV